MMGATRGASSRSTFSFAEGFETFVLVVSSATITTTVTSRGRNDVWANGGVCILVDVHKDFVP
jgi:hypothetical protein